MAVHGLHTEFVEAHKAISLRARALVAIAAHVEVRSVLRRSPELRTHGLDDVLVGSYARKVSIWPGKDVDVFGRLMRDSTTGADPDAVYALFAKALEHYSQQGRLTPQPRSLKVDFGPRNVPDEGFIRAAASEYQWTARQVDSVLADRDRLAFAFSVDVVPAVTWDGHYGIPELATRSSGDRYRTGRWRKTNPVDLTDRTHNLNRRIRIGGKGAYVPVVKTIRQLKKHRLEYAKPSSLYFELLLHEGFEEGAITGDSWADVTSSALDFPPVASGLRSTSRCPTQPWTNRTRRRPRLSNWIELVKSSTKSLDGRGERFGRRSAAKRRSSGGRSSVGTRRMTTSSRSPMDVGARVSPWERRRPTSQSEGPARGPLVPTDPPFDDAADPDRLRLFIAELEAEGFVRVDTWRWEGPTRRSLLDGGHTDSSRMTVAIRPSWPYLPPLLEVPGIAAWHADQERLCIWQAEDNSQRWTTLQGLYERIDEWAEQAQGGFAIVENARNPEIYWEEPGEVIAALVDLEELLDGDEAEGQHGEFHFAEAVSPDGRSEVSVFELSPGPFNAMTSLPGGITDSAQVRGRWFYRSTVVHPPRTLDEFLSQLTENQRSRLQRDMRDRPLLMFGLIWRNQAGLVSTMLVRAMREQDEPLLGLVILRPKGADAMLLRGGPDVAALRSRSVAVVGIGAVGSHVAENLARAGVGKLRIIDYDRIWPVNLIRHAAPPGTPAGMRKTEAMRSLLEQYPWVEVDIPTLDHATVIWAADGIADVLLHADLTIDATGHAGLAELIGRHAARLGRAFISVALFRGGAVARVRRQCRDGDTPIVQRPHLDRYLHIPPLDEEAEYVGTEVGCLSRVHNAPPVVVGRAGALAADVAIDHLTGRHDESDEVVEVFRRGDPPFDRLGRLRPDEFPVTVDVSEAAQWVIRTASRDALPNETGGVLIGCVIDGRAAIVDACEIRDPSATPKSYRVASGRTVESVEAARKSDPRVGYLGEWHSHPSCSDPSSLDTATMSVNSADAGVEHPILIVSCPYEISGDEDFRVFTVSPAGLRAASMVTTGGLPPLGVEETP